MAVQGKDQNPRALGPVTPDVPPDTDTADSARVATNTPAPINDWFGIYTKQASYRTYMIGADVPRDAVADALYWDSSDPYHYVRLERLGNRRESAATDLLLVGGEDHKTGQPGDRA